MNENVTLIPARIRAGNRISKEENKPKLRVAAYCRVSTDSDEQAGSYEVQVQHYTEYIGRNKEWKLAGTYTDDGISGTNTKEREGFNEMIDDCMAGKVDLIITKSISRFARNTIDCLKYVRQLREKNIAIIFEKENINTLDRGIWGAAPYYHGFACTAGISILITERKVGTAVPIPGRKGSSEP